MPDTKHSGKKFKSVQRKLDFGVVDKDSADDNDIVVVDEEPAKQASKKRSSSSAPKQTAKRHRGSFQSPTKDRKSTVVITPAGEAPEDYTPTHIHKNVEYLRKGKASLSPTKLKVFQLIEAHFEIPESFENKRVFGPLSGICFEERVITAYSLGKLNPVGSETCICTACAEIGHKRDECPSLL